MKSWKNKIKKIRNQNNYLLHKKLINKIQKISRHLMAKKWSNLIKHKIKYRPIKIQKLI